MRNRGNRYTVGDEARQEVLYAGADRDKAISALVTRRTDSECGYVTAEHVGGETATYCSEESCLLEDEAIKAWDEQERQPRNAPEAFHGCITGTAPQTLAASWSQHLTHEVLWPDGDLYQDAAGAARFTEGRARITAQHVGGTVHQAEKRA